MDVVLYDTVDEFLSATGTFLRRHPVVNQLILTDTSRLSNREPQDGVLLAAVFSEGDPVLAGIVTPPHKLSLSYVELPEFRGSVELLAEHLAQYQLSSVMGMRMPADVFSVKYCACRGTRCRTENEVGVYRLTKVIPPAACPGGLRRAVEADSPLLTLWREGFSADVQRPASRDEISESVRRDIASGSLFLWEHDKPVSTAASRRPLDDGISIGTVYTPPEFRRRGYASALVAALSQFLLDSGYSYCSLYTDLPNPTSNHIYQAIGYEPVCEVVGIEFDSPAAPSGSGERGT